MSVVRTRRKSGPECVRCGKRIWKCQGEHFCSPNDITKFVKATRNTKRLSAIPQKRCTQCRKVMRVTFKVEYQRVPDDNAIEGEGDFKTISTDTNEVDHYGHASGGNLFCSLRCGMTYAVKTVQRLNADQLRD